jgi:hypothetical protein
MRGLRISRGAQAPVRTLARGRIGSIRKGDRGPPAFNALGLRSGPHQRSRQSEDGGIFQQPAAAIRAARRRRVCNAGPARSGLLRDDVVWLVFYAVAIARLATLLRRSAIRRTLDAIMGAVLIALGLRLAVEQR